MSALAISRSRTERHPDLPGRPSGQAAHAGLGRAVRRNLTAHGFLIGAVLCFAFFSWYPMVREVVLAFQKTRRGRTELGRLAQPPPDRRRPGVLAGVAQHRQFTGLALLLGFVVPFLVAVVLNEFRHGQGYLRVAGLPAGDAAAGRLGAALQVLLRPRVRPVQPGAAAALHLPTSQWLQSTHTAMLSVVIASTWMNMGSATLIYLAALQGIPGELYEAAELDGAGIMRRIWHVTIPQTRLVLSLMLLMQIIATMQVFTEPYLLTGGAGPQGSTTTVVYLIYQYAFNFNNYGAAAALGLVLLVVLALFSGVYVRLSRSSDE